MEFQMPVSRVKTTVIRSKSERKILASEAVRGRMERGRHAITVVAQDADVFIGDETVTATTGLPLKQGEPFSMPVMSNKDVPVYVTGGTVVLMEYF